jgi:predicted nuclease of predicted toxin-antitoxin system
MKFLLDMGLAQSTARYLQTLGYDAIHLRDQGLQRLPDDQIIQKARVEGRVILTHDLDFSRLVAISQSQLPSVITFRLKDMRPAQVNHYLNEALDHFSPELQAGALMSIGDNGIRVRQLPIADQD